jgi:hypothetical protein
MAIGAGFVLSLLIFGAWLDSEEKPRYPKSYYERYRGKLSKYDTSVANILDS